MGRDRKVIGMNKHHFTKKEIEERIAAEQAYTLKRDALKAPEYLTEGAKAEFNKVVEMAFWTDNLDLNEIILHSVYWDRTNELLKEVSREDFSEVIEMRGGDGCPRLIPNPILKALKTYHDEMRKTSSKLGLTTIDRLKLMAPSTKKKKNKFAEFL